MTERTRWWDKLNRALYPYLGPAELGPFDQPPLPSLAAKACPLCGAPMTAHSVERPGGNVASRLHCPAPAVA